MTRIFAAADIGSNTAHLLVAATDGELVMRVDNYNEWIGLGEIVARKGEVPKENVEQLVQTMTEFRRMAKARGAGALYVFATEAIRKARNAEAVLKKVYQESGVKVEVIPPAREAELSLRGVGLDTRNLGADLMFEVGGGSAQVGRIGLKGFTEEQSLPLGTGRVIAESGLVYPTPEHVRRAAQTYIDRTLERLTLPATGTLAVASGGVVRGLWRTLHPDGDKTIMREELDYLVWAASRLPIDRMVSRFSVKSKRASTLLPGAMVYRALMARFGLESLVVSEFGIREGAILDLADGLAQGGSVRPTEPRFLNRELSWLQFNRRVLEEAANPANPLLERLKFLAIFESNLDEFYMVRVSGIIEQFESGELAPTPDGLSPNAQLDQIARTALPQRQRASRILEDDLKPLMEASGIHIRRYADLSPKRRRALDAQFAAELFPLITPLVLSPVGGFPFISNRSLNLAVLVTDGTEPRLARVKIPEGVARFMRISRRRYEYVLVEDFVAHNLQSLFPGMEIVDAWPFRVVRDADVESREIESADLMASIEETLRLRRFGAPVLLQFAAKMPPDVQARLTRGLELDESDLFPIDGMLGFESFWEIARIDKPALRFPPFVPHAYEALGGPALYETIRAGDVLMHHPYDSFRAVEEFVASAAKDPAVVGIKGTLYRVGKESPLVESLLEAAEAGKQVAATVELRARFDESNNLGWARALERAGVHVTFGLPDLKTHSKLFLTVRREASGIRRYAHIGTGNYNPSTARLYTDVGLFTDDEAICQDISELFNYLTGFSRHTHYRKLLVAPFNLRSGILERIRREAKLKKEGRIVFKLNALVDPEIVETLYAAHAQGVEVSLIVRGVCCLRPGVPGLSEGIRVVSVVGRLLEHSRVYWFGHGGRPDVLIGSADLMRRNLDRRIETLVPIEEPRIQRYLWEEVLQPSLRDNVRAWDLLSDGTYIRHKDGERPFDSQTYLQAHPAAPETMIR